MDQVILTDAHWRDFLNMFNQAHPQFLVALSGRYPSLTQSETRLCCLTYLSLSDREMADMLGVGTNSIRVTRNRVRKKLLIVGDQDLRALLKAL
jgi:DNA-binding CsgD family transcriptional regulator